MKVDVEKSVFYAKVGKSGLLSFMGHEHGVIARKWRIEGTEDRPLIILETASMVADTPDARKIVGLGEGPNASDIKETQERMLGERVLDVAKYPEIRFQIQSIGSDKIKGQLTLHGHTREVEASVRVTTESGQRRATGSFKIDQSDFGITPLSIAGVVNVKDEVTIGFDVRLPGL